MNNAPLFKEINGLVAKSNFVKEVELRMNALNTSPHKLSLGMGYNRGYIYGQLKHNDQFASLLVLLTHHLQANMFQPFLDLLPPQYSATKREQELQNQVAVLQQQMNDIAKERDIYKTIALK